MVTVKYPERRRGRVAEGGGLLNRYTLSRRIEGSNPSVSASAGLSDLDTWVTERTYDIGDNLGPNGLSTGCKVLCSRSI